MPHAEINESSFTTRDSTPYSPLESIKDQITKQIILSSRPSYELVGNGNVKLMEILLRGSAVIYALSRAVSEEIQTANYISSLKL
jgi:hypothetical protein